LPISTGDAVLDIGTGTGVIIPVLRSIVGNNGFLTAMDYAEKMLNQALLKMPAERIFIAADIHSTPLTNGTFNAAVCFNCFPHFQDKHRAFSEMYRILKPGGAFFGSIPFLVGVHADPHDYVRMTKEGLRKEFTDAGFKDAEVFSVGRGPFTAGYAQVSFLFPGILAVFFVSFCLALDWILRKTRPLTVWTAQIRILNIFVIKFAMK